MLPNFERTASKIGSVESQIFVEAEEVKPTAKFCRQLIFQSFHRAEISLYFESFTSIIPCNFRIMCYKKITSNHNISQTGGVLQ